MKSNLSKFLAKLMLSYLTVSSVGFQISAMELQNDTQNSATAQIMMYKLDNSILAYLALKTKLDFLDCLKKALKNYINDINNIPALPNISFNNFLESAMNNYEWTCPESADTTSSVPFCSLTDQLRAIVLGNIKKFCESISFLPEATLKAFYIKVKNEFDGFSNNPLKLCKQHAQNDECYDKNYDYVDFEDAENYKFI